MTLFEQWTLFFYLFTYYLRQESIHHVGTMLGHIPVKVDHNALAQFSGIPLILLCLCLRLE